MERGLKYSNLNVTYKDVATEYKILEYTDEQENNPFRVWFFDLNVRSKRYKNSP